MGEISPRELEEVLARLDREITGPLNLMEVCGTHTVALLKFGFKGYFQNRINFLSGPGCPVCVTTRGDIDRVIALADAGVTLVSFGDLLRAPGGGSSLAAKRAEGRRVHIVYNPLEALRIAAETKQETVFVALGFETTAPAVAALVQEIIARGVKNLSLFPLLKTIPPALEHLLAGMEHNIDGLICPGHVSAVIGAQPYSFIPERFGLPCVITGFEREDLAAGILSLVRQIRRGRPGVENCYPRVVREDGNPKARRLVAAFFQETTAGWRGLGEIPASGLTLRPEYAAYHVLSRVSVPEAPAGRMPDCLCGEIICGRKTPVDCPLFGRECTPENPVGPCMVSSEGSCRAYYLYGREYD